MKAKRNNNGFSLTEVLMAVGILGIGLVFIAGVFPVGIRFTTIATERTKGAVTADEAFAKIRLYGIDFYDFYLLAPDANECVDFNEVSDSSIALSEFAYPSTNTAGRRTYYWSALCRRVVPNTSLVQVTVFVCRRIGADTQYRLRQAGGSLSTVPEPVPVWVEVRPGDRDDELLIDDPRNDGIDEATFVNDGCTIVDDATGRLYRVLERVPGDPPNNDIIKLGRNWQGPFEPAKVWVIPPPVNGGRYPCVAIYQRVIKF
jgi:prepilin-type N-terminal cleavage/methylation domain-containing protein